MTRDFTLQAYEELCSSLKDLQIPVMTVTEFLDSGQPYDFLVVIRHDVDRSLKSAVRMSRLEARMGIRSTYYIRMTRAVFRKEEIKQIARDGHEIGYHYETLSRACGDMEKAKELFQTELGSLRNVVSVNTASMHGSPLSPYNNLDFWNLAAFEHFGLIGDFSISIDFSKAYYFTDTGRSWNAVKYNLRDHIGSLTPSVEINSTFDLISFIRGRADGPVLINAHPNRWSSRFIEWFVSLGTDISINQAKRIISYFRRKK